MSCVCILQETYQCIPNLAAADSVVMLTMVHVLHREFLNTVLEGYAVHYILYLNLAS